MRVKDNDGFVEPSATHMLNVTGLPKVEVSDYVEFSIHDRFLYSKVTHGVLPSSLLTDEGSVEFNEAVSYILKHNAERNYALVKIGGKPTLLTVKVRQELNGEPFRLDVDIEQLDHYPATIMLTKLSHPEYYRGLDEEKKDKEWLKSRMSWEH